MVTEILFLVLEDFFYLMIDSVLNWKMLLTAKYLIVFI